MNADDDGLWHAVVSGNVARVEQLIACRCDPESKDARGRTALSLAAAKNRIPCLRLLIGARCSLDATDDCGWTALFHAADAGCQRAVDLLCDAGAGLGHQAVDGSTCLFHAANLGCTQRLLTLKVDASHRDLFGRSALFSRAASASSEWIQLLVRSASNNDAHDYYGLLITDEDVFGQSVLDYAFEAGHLRPPSGFSRLVQKKMIHALPEEEKCMARSLGCDEAAFQAAICSRVSGSAAFGQVPPPVAQLPVLSVRRLLSLVSSGAISALKDELHLDRNTAVGLAARVIFQALCCAAEHERESQERCKLIVETFKVPPGSIGCDPLTRQTPLHRAAAYGSRDCVAFLISCRCDVNHPDALGQPPVYLAAARGRLDTVVPLLVSKCDLEHRDRYGLTPLMVAERFGQRDLLPKFRQLIKRMKAHNHLAQTVDKRKDCLGAAGAPLSPKRRLSCVTPQNAATSAAITPTKENTAQFQDARGLNNSAGNVQSAGGASLSHGTVESSSDGRPKKYRVVLRAPCGAVLRQGSDEYDAALRALRCHPELALVAPQF